MCVSNLCPGKFSLIQRAVFYAKIAEKTYNTKRGLNRHQSVEHRNYTNTYEERLPLDTFEQSVIISNEQREAGK